VGFQKLLFGERCSCLLIEFRDEDVERDLGLKKAIARIDKIAAIFGSLLLLACMGGSRRRLAYLVTFAFQDVRR
jgi:hypothetical protein